MRNVFFPSCRFKNPKQIKAMLVAGISGLQFPSLQNFTAIVSLFRCKLCTFCWWTQEKRKSTGQMQEIKLPEELEAHKKAIIQKDTWAYDLTKLLSLQFPNSSKPAGTPITCLADLATLGCWGCQPFKSHSTWLEQQQNACVQVHCWGAEGNSDATAQT